MKNNEKSRVIWHCRRGMLELDLILQQFLDKRYDSLSVDERVQFESLLNYTDPQLFAWLMGHEEPQDSELKQIVTIIRTVDKA